MTAGQVTTVILGAGASYDAADTNLPADSAYQPPLTRQLFDVSARGWLGEFVSQLPGVYRLLPELVRAAQSDVRGLEARLTELASDPNSERKYWFLDVPPFLQAQIHAVSRKYIKLRDVTRNRHPAAGNYHRLVDTLLHEPGARVVFITLNYDDFMEQALSDSAIERMEDYANPHRRWRLIKLHGSINWFQDLSTAWDPTDADFPKTWREALQAFEIGDFDPSTRLVWDVDRVWRSGPPFLYPVLTVPIVQKPASAIRCPPALLKAASEWMAQSTRTLIIGTSGHDEDLADLLREKLTRPQDTIHIVTKGREADARALRERFWDCTRRNGDGSCMQVFPNGFHNYLWDGGFDTFLGRGKPPRQGYW